jgi:serine/threonine protein phosphatase PrpC
LTAHEGSLVTQPHSPISSPAVGDEGGSVSPGGHGEIQVRLFARTDVGQVREHNEDNFLVADLTRRQRGLMEANRQTSIGPQGCVFAVCDGMGGAAAGEIASQLAVDIICEKMSEGLDENTPIRRDEIGRRLVRSVEAAGLVDDVLFLAQVGDSRGYILRDGSLTQVTRDQSLVNQLIEAGQLTEEEAETFEHNNIILQALGTSDTVQVDLTYVELRKGDILLLCSDGLSGMVRFDEIREILRSTGDPLDTCKALTERANQAGGHDNITVIVVQFDGEGIKPLGGETEPLKYRKYTLPEEPLEATESHRRQSLRDMAAAASVAPTPGMPGNYTGPQDGSGGAHSHPPTTPILSSVPVGPWHERGPHGDGGGSDEERILIPGTHVPAWVVVALVVGVVALLGATAFLLLR